MRIFYICSFMWSEKVGQILKWELWNHDPDESFLVCYWFLQRIRPFNHLQIYWSQHWSARCGYYDKTLPKRSLMDILLNADIPLNLGFQWEPCIWEVGDTTKPSFQCSKGCIALTWRRFYIISWGTDGNEWVIISGQGYLKGTAFWIGPTHGAQGRPGWRCWQKVL